MENSSKFIGNLSFKEVKEITIAWLESNQINGAFDGYFEENKNFKKLSDEEIEWYFNNWIVPDYLDRGEIDLLFNGGGLV